MYRNQFSLSNDILKHIKNKKRHHSLKQWLKTKTSNLRKEPEAKPRPQWSNQQRTYTSVIRKFIN